MPDLSIKRSRAVQGFVVLCLCAAAGMAKGGDLPRGEGLTKHIRYGFTLRNQGGSLLPETHFWTYAPVKKTAFQQCVRVRASHPYELIEDEWGNQILHFTFRALPPYAVKVIDIRAELRYSGQPRPSEGKDIFREPGGGADIGELAELAGSLRGQTPVGTANKIHRWVAHHIKYTGYSAGGRDVAQTLKRRQGDCTEFMDLFVALARADGIPARGIAGYVLPAGGVLRPTEFHNWAEFHDGGAWRLADPQRNVFMRSQTDYVAMRLIAPSAINPMGEFNRFRFAGDGLRVEMKL